MRAQRPNLNVCKRVPERSNRFNPCPYRGDAAFSRAVGQALHGAAHGKDLCLVKGMRLAKVR